MRPFVHRCCDARQCSRLKGHDPNGTSPQKPVPIHILFGIPIDTLFNLFYPVNRMKQKSNAVMIMIAVIQTTG